MEAEAQRSQFVPFCILDLHLTRQRIYPLCMSSIPTPILGQPYTVVEARREAKACLAYGSTHLELYLVLAANNVL